MTTTTAYETTVTTATEVIDAHTGNQYGCYGCDWRNPVEVRDSKNGVPDPTLAEADRAQARHAAEKVLAAVWTPRGTEFARREVRRLLPDLPAGKDVTVAIAALSAVLPDPTTKEAL